MSTCRLLFTTQPPEPSLLLTSNLYYDVRHDSKDNKCVVRSYSIIMWNDVYMLTQYEYDSSLALQKL